MFNSIEEEIKRAAVENGAFQIGFGKIEFKENEKFYGYKSVISIIFPLFRGIMENVVDGPTYEYFHHYRTVNRTIDDITLRIGKILEREGKRAYPIAASQSVKGNYEGAFSHKRAAVISGMGWIGKSDLLITSENGARVRLGTVLTDYEFENYGTPVTESKCGSCTICENSCPAMAIRGVNWKSGMKREELYDAKACSDYMKSAFKDIGRGAVCGICVSSCPYSKTKKI